MSSQSAAEGPPPRLRIIIADSEAIFRVGMSKIFAAQPDIEVVAQTETLSQTLNAATSMPTDVILFESGLSPNPADFLILLEPTGGYYTATARRSVKQGVSPFSRERLDHPTKKPAGVKRLVAIGR